MIPKNTPIPYSKTEIFTTAEDNQTAVEIHVVQGERPMAQDNKTLARFILDGIPPAPRGIPQIEVVFDIDVNGILTVTAKDKATGKTQSVKISGSTNLSKEEIERLKKEAEMFAEEDAKKRKLAETKNQADNLIHQSRKLLNEYKDKIHQELYTQIEEKIKELEKTKESNNIDEIESKIKDLANLLSSIGKQFYGQQQPDNS
jgi:molecular chaperone DnaK